MPARHIALGRLIDEALRSGGWSRALGAVSGVPLGPEHRRWLSSMCMLGALSPQDVNERLCRVLEVFEPGGRLASWLPPGMRQHEREHLLNAIVTGREGGALYNLHSNAGAGQRSNPEFTQEIAAVADEMDQAGHGTIWPGAIPVRSGDHRTRAHRLIAGLIDLMYPLTGSCMEIGPVDALTRCGILRDRSWLDGARVESCDPLDPNLAILEAEPSWWKTAEALAHGVRQCLSGRNEGITWLLPTREAARHVWLQLCQMIPNAIIVLGLWQDQEPHSGPGLWFLEPRYRNFAAPICVATMDHGYKAIRNVPHSWAYAATVARNLLILDGLTPADTRNLCLGSAFIHEQLRAGGSALVVTSGLDQTSRQVIDAFAQDPVGADPDYVEQPFAPYGAVWTRPAPNVPLQPRALPIRNTQRIHVELWEAEEDGHHRGALREAVQRARDGYRVAVIRTTNRGVYDTAQFILNDLHGADVMLHAAGPGYEPAPVTFRSRYFAPERHCIDDALRAEFDISRRRNGRLVVASGLIDHSIDTSFDFVVTDLPPFDLLIRRMALLSRGGPGCWRPEPEIRVLLPEWAAEPQTSRILRHPHAVEATYNDLILRGHHEFTFDCTRERLEAVYRRAYPMIPTSDRDGLEQDMMTARGLAIPNAIGVQPGADPMMMRGERTQPIRFEPGIVSALGFPLDRLVFYARQDMAYAPYDVIAPNQGVHQLDWAGNIQHRADSLGYYNPNANPDEDPNVQDYDYDEHE
jgi:hypothetical protein